MKTYILLNSSEDKENAGFLLTEAENYLMCHGFNNIEIDWTDETIIDIIESKYFDKVDLIVLGANSRKGFLKFVLGSVAKSLIKKEQNFS